MFRRRIFIYAALAATLFIQSAIFNPAKLNAQTASTKDVVMILPFENTSNLWDLFAVPLARSGWSYDGSHDDADEQ